MFLIAVSALAAPTTYSVDMAVWSTHPAWMAPTTEVHISRDLVKVDHPDVLVSSTHPLVTCKIKDGWVRVDFVSDAASYPTTFPFTATCSYQEYVLNVNVVKQAAQTDRSLQSMQIDSNDTVAITKVKGDFTVTTYRLPSCDVDYKYRVPVAAKGVSGVDCEAIQQDGLDILKVTTVASSKVGVGSCAMPLVDGSFYDILVDLDEGPI